MMLLRVARSSACLWSQPGTTLLRPFVGQTTARAYRRFLKRSFVLAISARDFSIVCSVAAISAVSTRGASSGLGMTSRRRQFLETRPRGLRDNRAMEPDCRSSPAIPTPGNRPDARRRATRRRRLGHLPSPRQVSRKEVETQSAPVIEMKYKK
jgi:hypothetical protein